MARKDELLREIQSLAGLSVTKMAAIGVRFDAREIEILREIAQAAFDRGHEIGAAFGRVPVETK